MEEMEEDYSEIEGDHAEITTSDDENFIEGNHDKCAEPNKGLQGIEEDPNPMEEEFADVNTTEWNQEACLDPIDPTAGMEFESYIAAGNFYDSYAKRVGFETKIRQSSSNRKHGKWYVQFSCNKEGFKRAKIAKGVTTRPNRADVRCGCLATMKIKLIEHNKWRVIYVNLTHNHALSPGKTQQGRSRKKLDDRAKRRSPLTAKVVLKVDRTCQSFVTNPEEHEQLPFGEKECHIDKCSRLDLGEGDAETLGNFFAQMQVKNPNFFYSIDLNEEGCLRNVFWVNGKSRMAYEYFRDVVTFDNTYLISKYNLKIALFVGANHHGQPVLLGCALLSSETKESFMWLFKTWLMSMSDRPPGAIISCQSESIQEAVAEMFPQAHYRFCLVDIMKKVPEKLGSVDKYEEIKEMMERVVYESLRVHEFEQNWIKMITKYNLEDNAWLNTLYQLREKWVPAFLKNAFWAGMSTTRIKGSNSFFNNYLHSITSLKEFFMQYELALQDKYDKEALADFTNFNSRSALKQPHWFEAQLFNIYTIDVFRKFQQEVRGMLCCYDMSAKHVNGPITTYVLKERIMDMDGRLFLREYEVYYNKDEVEIACICNLFQFEGFLCRHAMYILQNHGVAEIPSRYIVARWRKDYKLNHSLNYESDILKLNTVVRRYDHLHSKGSKIVEEGVISEKGCLVALQILEEGLLKIRAANDLAFKEQGGETTFSSDVNNALDINVHHDMPVLNPTVQRIAGQPNRNIPASNSERLNQNSSTNLAFYDTCTLSGSVANPTTNACKKSKSGKLRYMLDSRVMEQASL